MPQISAVIITFNEEKYIGNCLESLKDVADEIVVVDSFSTDSTEDICRKHNVRFIKHEFTGFMDQKNYALTLASHKFVLSLDADEALSENLQQSLLKLKNNLDYDGYLFNRLGSFCGQWIRHSSWYPDRQLRLFNKEKGRFGTINIHETFKMNHGARKKRVKGDILHWTCESENEFSEKITRYSIKAAEEYFKAGIKVYFFTPAVHMIWRFILTYFIRLGFLDGRNGLTICSLIAYSSYLKYAKIIELHKAEKRK